MANQTDFDKKLEDRFAQLPKIVQNAITSADVEKHLRELADAWKLHLDQWQKLENEVMLALYGFQPAENLEQNIRSEIGLPKELAHDLAENINKIVFEPIRQELERQLEHPEAKEKELTGVEMARNQALAGAQAPAAPAAAPTPAAPAVQPATPPAPVPDVKVTRPTETSNYKPGETSAQRTAVHEDPYREPPV